MSFNDDDNADLPTCRSENQRFRGQNQEFINHISNKYEMFEKKRRKV